MFRVIAGVRYNDERKRSPPAVARNFTGDENGDGMIDRVVNVVRRCRWQLTAGTAREALVTCSHTTARADRRNYLETTPSSHPSSIPEFDNVTWRAGAGVGSQRRCHELPVGIHRIPLGLGEHDNVHGRAGIAGHRTGLFAASSLDSTACSSTARSTTPSTPTC